MIEIVDLLRKHSVTSVLDESVLELIAGCARNVVFETNATIFRHGEDASEFYLLRHGSVALEMCSPGRGLVTFLTLKPGQLLGASWLVPPYRWAYDARATTQTRAVSFDAKCLREKCEEDHHVGYAMMKCCIPILIERMNIARLQSADVFGNETDWKKTFP